VSDVRCPCGLHDREDFYPECPFFKDARAAIALWEADPKRQALARILNIPPGQVTDAMIRRVCTPAMSYRNPPMQQIPREPRRRKP
jgi:hypothetical protein